MQQTGIYEQLITQLLERRLDRNQFYVGERPVEKAEAAIWLSRHLTHILEVVLASVPAGDEQLALQIKLSNQLLMWVKEHSKDAEFIDDNLVESKGKILTALYGQTNPIATDLQKYVQDIFPLTGLTQSELFSGSNAGLSLESELKREIMSAHEIYWLVSFIKWSGIRIFRRELEEFTRNGGKLKVITTTYMGATDAKAVEYIASLPNTEVKLSYRTNQERLHAKSYLFVRDTGFHTGYIGSSNLSHSALTNGLEWNLKITSQEIPHIINKSLSTFKTYWAANEFEVFDGSPSSVEQLNQALKKDRLQPQKNAEYFFDVKPYHHQLEILERLQVERSLHQRYRNLVVAATGTGKTLISAFDFARFAQQNPNATFLFIAHREEILKQAREAYRGVLKNSNFGELWVGGTVPSHHRQLFASIQTLNNQLANLPLTPDYYDYIVIDEVHHIAASSYRALLAYFSPRILLGLTATPERHDGADILSDFGGVIAAEIRLPEAINRRHLCPFQYFGIDDDTDLRNVSWSRGRYDVGQLSDLYTNNQARVNKILRSLSEVITDINKMKALGFCVSREHANYMHTQFQLKDIPSAVLTSDNSDERQQMQQALRSGAIKILFVVDIFNEGVDIPEVDTLLFMRPTESLTLFLQQFGRGLRLAQGKECCTVLDFVGNSRPEYDFSSRFRALVGKTNRAIDEEIKQDFPHAPLGCRIELSKRTQEIVLRNISQATLNQQRLRGLITQFPHQSDLPLSLANFLKIYPQVQLEHLYKKGTTWTSLVASTTESIAREAIDTVIENAYYRAINTRLLSSDSFEYFQFLQQLCNNNFALSNDTDPRMALMCHYDFWQSPGSKLGYADLDESLAALNHTDLKKELNDVLQILMDRAEHEQPSMTDLANNPLRLHARYAREQILAGFGATTFDKQSPAREGVLALKEQNVELLFVTLNKSDEQFSPTTMYHDYAISEQLFHWQSQNSARPDRGKGLEYIQHQTLNKRLFLFVREQSQDEWGRTMGFVNFGEVSFVSSSGSQPMNITWRLATPMPAFMWKQAAKLAVG